MEGGVGGGVVGDKVRRAYRDESEDGLALKRTIIVCTSSPVGWMANAVVLGRIRNG